MTGCPSQISTGLRSLRDNPDICALVVLALALMVIQPAAAMLPSPGMNVHGLPPGLDTLDPVRGEFAAPDRPFALRLRPIADIRDEADDLDLTLDQWVARFEQKRERVWRRLEEKMRRLEQRVEMQENKIRTRSVSVWEE